MTTFTVDRQRFGIETDPHTGTPYIHSIHPYDETEYHWAPPGCGRCTAGESWSPSSARA